MNKEEAREILKNENLKRFNWFKEYELSPHEVVIEYNTNDGKCYR